MTTSLDYTTNAGDTRTTPLAGIAAAALGSALIGMARRGRAGTLLRLAGVGLIGYALRPVAATTIRRAGAARRQLEAHRSVDIDRPIADVFAFFKDFESFPHIAGRLRSVTDYQNGLSRWEAYGPSGDIIAWDVVVTKYLPNSVIAWESAPRSGVDMHGLVRFTALGPSRTRIDVDVAYRPEHTGFGEAMLTILAPRQVQPLANFLERLRFYLESLPPTVPSSGAE